MTPVESYRLCAQQDILATLSATILMSASGAQARNDCPSPYASYDCSPLTVDICDTTNPGTGYRTVCEGTDDDDEIYAVFDSTNGPFIWGDDGDDLDIYGGDDADDIDGGDGADTIWGGDGDDCICAGMDISSDTIDGETDGADCYYDQVSTPNPDTVSNCTQMSNDHPTVPCGCSM